MIDEDLTENEKRMIVYLVARHSTVLLDKADHIGQEGAIDYYGKPYPKGTFKKIMDASGRADNLADKLIKLYNIDLNKTVDF